MQLQVSCLSTIIRQVQLFLKLKIYSYTVQNRFNSIPNKGKARFIKFDIAEFYPSISECLLDKAIAYAKRFTEISDETIRIIKLSRKSLLFDHSNDTWQKKGENPMFDVTMGSYDGAEVCELVGLYLLHKLFATVPKEHIGLYRDDGLAAIPDANGRKIDSLRKKIINIFKNENLSITIEVNLLATDFLDVTLDLTAGKYFPFRKPNDKPLYINTNSNHPPSITKQLPKMIEKRLSMLNL